MLEPSTIHQLVSNQARELELRAHELDLQQQRDRNDFEFAKASLNAQAEDRRDARVFQRQQRRNAYILSAGLSLIVAALIGAAMWLNKDQVALEVIKSLVLLLSGGGAGYALGRHTSQPSQTPTSDDP